MSSPPAEPPELDSFGRFCGKFLTTENGRPLELHDFQRRMLRDYFAGTTETLILIPKKNGKTTLLAALALYHLCTTPDAECVIVAASRDQASVMLRQAQGFIKRSPALNGRLTVKQREIIDGTLGGRVRVLASDKDTADGVIPTLVLVDELHRHKSDELYAILRDGLGPRNGQVMTISTAADSLETPLGRMRRTAYALSGMQRDGTYRYVHSEGFALHEWALDESEDVEDMAVVKRANPAPWQTEAILTKRHDSPTMRPWQWKRFACGLWVGGEDAAVSDREWMAAAVEGLALPVDAEVVIGVDIGRRSDCTAIVAVAKVGEEFWIEPLAVIPPPDDGTYIPEEDIWAPLSDAAERWPRATFLADPKLGGDLFMERLEREHPSVTTAVFDQVASALARMAAQFTEQLAGGRLKHPDNPTFNAHVLAAGQKPIGEGFRFVKQRQKRLPIDALIAAGMALSNLLSEDAEPEYARASWR